MKKRFGIVLLMFAVLVMAWLPAAAEEHNIVNLSNGHYYCSPGMERVGYYDDYTSKIGSGLTLDDFDITYESASEYVTVLDETGRVMISPDAPLYNNLRLNITYTPKVEGVGTKTTFVVVLRTSAPIETFEADVSRVCIQMKGDWVDVYITGIQTYDKQLVNISYDPAVMKLDTYKYMGRILNYQVHPVGVGETELVFTAYNGWQIRIPVYVVARATQVEFGADSFACYVGDTVDLGLDLGNGELGVEACKPSVYMTREGTQVSRKEFFPADANSFYAKEAGYYLVKITAGYNVSNEVMIHVYDKAVCERIELSSGDLYQDREGTKVLCYDAEGNSVMLPLSITAGEDIATLEGRTITATGAGSVTVTAENADGTTISRTFDVKVNPTEMSLNAEELTLEIEDTFDLEVSFDQGTYPHTYAIAYENQQPAFGLHCIRMEEDKIIAQAPGKATITVTAGPFKKTCTVTVPDGDKALTLVLPPEPFGIGHTFQLTVQDKTGMIYPAVFEIPYGDSYAYELTEDGKITGKNESAQTVRATLADGRVLEYYLWVYKVPTWISHPNKVVSLSEGSINLYQADSDVGKLSVYHDTDFTIADTSIATRWNDATIDLHKAGITTITMWSELNPEAKCTFFLEVVDKTVPLVGQTTIDLPYGFQVQLPNLTDASGNTIQVDWQITYQQPGEGNPESSGFTLEDNWITCTWPTATCVVTGTISSGAVVKVIVNGYKLPEEIWFEQEIIELPLGGQTQLNLLFDDPGAEVKQVYWVADTEGIVTLKEMTSGTSQTVSAQTVGTTLIMAFLDNEAYALCMVTVYDPNAEPDEPDDPTDRLPGDADKDGAVTIMDALMTLQYSVGWDVDISLSNAEVDADGAVTIMDALLILQYCVGWDVELL